MCFNTIYIGYLQFVKYSFLRLGQYQLRIRIICKNSIKYTYSRSSSLYISTFLQTIRIQRQKHILLHSRYFIDKFAENV